MSTLRFFFSRPIKAKKIKLAVDHRCELCGREAAIDDLELHALIDREQENERPPVDLESFLIVLCPLCHFDVHRYGASFYELSLLVGKRHPDVRREIRDILAYVPIPYTPPDTDMEEAYKDACSSRFRFGV